MTANNDTPDEAVIDWTEGLHEDVTGCTYMALRLGRDGWFCTKCGWARGQDLRPRCMDCSAPVDVHEVPSRPAYSPINRPCGCVAASLDFRHLSPDSGRAETPPKSDDNGSDRDGAA